MMGNATQTDYQSIYLPSKLYTQVENYEVRISNCACGVISNVLLVTGDVGTAASYDPPYLPTRCNRYSRQDQFPEGGMFTAASNGLWDNGAACGRRYRMRCISGLKRPCKDGTIVVEVVDVCRTNPCPATLVLSNKAFDAISRIPDSKINIEYAQI